MFDETLTKVGNTLIGYCREGKEAQGLDELYAQDCVSVEALGMPGNPGPEFAGLDAIKAKHDWWFENNEIHSSSVEGPFFHADNQFSAIFEMDVTDKNSNQRMQMKEVAVYTVENGKIIREQFYYNM